MSLIYTRFKTSLASLDCQFQRLLTIVHGFFSSFLNEIRGTVDYILLGTWGSGPQQVFTMGANIDGVPYSGNGPNKKDAKKACAKDILLKLYSIRA